MLEPFCMSPHPTPTGEQKRLAVLHGCLMGLLVSCWFIIETILIPQGFAKWRRLSFFIHPLLLVSCQLFWLAKILAAWALLLLVHPLKILCHVILVVFRSFRRWVVGLILVLANLIKPPVESADQGDDDESCFEDCPQSWEEAEADHDPARSVVLCDLWYEADHEVENSCRRIVPISYCCNSFRIRNANVTVQQYCHDHKVYTEEVCLELEQVKPEDVMEISCADIEDHQKIKLRSSTLRDANLLSTEEQIGVEEIEGVVFLTLQTAGGSAGGEKELLQSAFQCEGDEEELDGTVAFPMLRFSGSELLPDPAISVEGDAEELEECEAASPIPEISWNQDGGAEVVHVHHDRAGLSLAIRGTEGEQHHDLFYKEYLERMGWFDRLNHERICEASAILDMEIGDPSFLEHIEAKITSLQGIKIQDLVRCIESDLERVYVAHSCLGWEALHHHYWVVESLVASPSSTSVIVGVSCGRVTAKFQQFQVLLGRYMENECKEVKRFWKYSHSRFSARNLLQVPEISGLGVDVVDEVKLREETTSTAISDLPAAIEKSIQLFWAFLESDNCRSSGKWKNKLWIDLRLEDPRDLDLLDKLKEEVYEKEKRLKNLQRTRKRWWKKTTPLDSQSGMEVLFSLIDVKLVSRVLRMSAISTYQLRWCEEKLRNIELTKGKVMRSSNSTLFPSS